MIDLDVYYLHFFRCWYYEYKIKKERLFEVTKEQLRKDNAISLQSFFDLFINCGQYYREIFDAKGNLTEVEVYEYFKLKGNIQVRSTFLALKNKNAEGILTDTVYENIIYSNKSARKNASSKLLVYLLKPLFLEEEKNKFSKYDFTEFNIE